MGMYERECRVCLSCEVVQGNLTTTTLPARWVIEENAAPTVGESDAGTCSIDDILDRSGLGR